MQATKLKEVLEDEFLTVRRHKAGDAELLYEAVMDSFDELSRWMPWCDDSYSLDSSKEWISLEQRLWDEGNEYAFAIFEKGKNKLIGGCGLNRLDRLNRTGNLGYWVRSGYTKKGYASKAAMLAVKFGLIDLGLNRIEIICATENKASSKVANKLGAKKEASLRSRLIINEKVHDAYLYSITSSDFIER
jgi:RimJ/RimL family protein N-acetyltransferase